MRDLFIGGRSVPASDAGRFDVIDPATGDVLQTVANGTTVLSPGEVAERVISHFDLPGAPGFLLLSKRWAVGGFGGGDRRHRVPFGGSFRRVGRHCAAEGAPHDANTTQ